jgi:hypothetical protein
VTSRDDRPSAARVAGVSPLQGGSFARALPGGSPTGAAAAAHGCPATGRYRSRRNVLDVAPRELVSAVMRRARYAHRRENVTVDGAGTPRIVRVGPSSVKGTQRSFLTASQKRSPGPTLERRRPLPTQRA